MDMTTSDLAQYQSDHDVLIELRTEMRLLRGDIKEMKDASTISVTDHEQRIRNLEKNLWRFSGGVLVLSTLVGYLVQIYAGS